MSSDLIIIAENLAAAGISVIPIRPDGSKGAAVEWAAYQSKIADKETLYQWFGNGSRYGIAAIGGEVSGNLEILDIDAPELAREWADLIRQQGAADLLQRLVIIQTPRSGWHIYYRCSAVEGNMKLAQRPNPTAANPHERKTLFETRGRGGYVLLPGSPAECHETRKLYELKRGDLANIPTITPEERALLLDSARAFDEMPVKPARTVTGESSKGDRPGDNFGRAVGWAEILEAHGWKRIYSRGDKEYWQRPGKKGLGISATANYASSGLLYVFSSNAAPFELQTSYTKFAAYALLNHNGDFKAAARELAKQGFGSQDCETENRTKVEQPGRGKDHQDSTVQPRPLDLVSYGQHDRGNAERIIAAAGEQLRFCYAFRKYLVWDNRRWAVDESGRALRLATLTMVEFVSQAVANENPELQKFAKNSLNARQLKAALELAQPDLAVLPADLDRDQWLLNCLNGIVDLRTGKLLPHDSAKLITKLVHFDYDPMVTAPTFAAFLNRIMGGKTELIEWLQKALGYSITGVTSEKAVFILWGPTNTGKSTLLTAIRSVLKEYSALIQVDTLMMRREESNNSQADLADLRGGRFVMTSETESGQRLAIGKLKRITQGQGDIKAVRKYENPITFAETHKLWMDANHKPHIRDTDLSIWNRLYTIPFEITLPESEQDKKLPDKLQAEGAGILAWLVAGAIRWYQEGLGKPPEIQTAGENWRQEEDTLGDFIAECCLLRMDAVSTIKQLYEAYLSWCKQNDEENPLGKKRFIAELVERGCNKNRDQNSWKLSGVELRGLFQ